ncbi:SDR family oxidoreductase [Corynebacterium sp. zg-331]|uniref:SDR family oxidoreductase n=1 Tax=unclassified Corynebacterium TaxID=2624378 RepID=UPI00128CA53B|nr:MULTISPECIES: SDR family oxidoreductase [unclassified Corynebacterium]MBC3185171.1 SDR family oxidoreductase [Corynebacterium sp. zg-331]MPV51669.1 NAD(P)H-binding protein [Corynebacterium sp. zg331]
MTDKKKVIVVGGHGKVALLATPLLAQEGYEVSSVIRAPEQAEEVRAARANPVVTDVAAMSAEEMGALFAGYDAVVWSAGAGGGAPERTYAVDRDAAIRSMQAAAMAGVKRYVMVSWVGSVPDHGVPEEEAFFAYADAKLQADEYLRRTDLDWTILGPSALTSEPGAGAIQPLAPEDDWREKGTTASRENVAKAIVAAVGGAGVGMFLRFNDGAVPVSQALRSE